MHFGNENQVFVLKKFNSRSAAASYYNAQRRLCATSKEIVSQLTKIFLQTTYISRFLTHEVEFNQFINASVQNFKILVPVTSFNLLQLIRDTTQGNQLLTGTFSNAILQYNTSSNNEENNINILWINPLSESCNCGISSDSCQLLYNDYCNHSYTNHSFGSAEFGTCDAPVPGLYITCYLLSGMSLSSLECYYDPNCLSSK